MKKTSIMVQVSDYIMAAAMLPGYLFVRGLRLIANFVVGNFLAIEEAN